MLILSMGSSEKSSPFLVAIPTIVLQFTAPFQNGFFPNDTAISYPQRPNTVSMVWAAFFGLGAPLLAVSCIRITRIYLQVFIIEIYISYQDGFPRDSSTKMPVVSSNFPHIDALKGYHPTLQATWVGGLLVRRRFADRSSWKGVDRQLETVFP